MTFRRAWLLILAALFVAATVAFFVNVRPAESEPLPHIEIEATAEDYERICGLAEVECQNEATATVTGYTSRPEETDDSPCIAAFNDDICALKAKGVNVCASNDYPKGTRLNIDGLGECVVLDRMNRRYTGKGRIDWYFGNDLTGARAWGVQKNIHITVY